MNNIFGRSFWVGTSSERAVFAPVQIGSRFYATDTGELHLWTGAAWTKIGPGSGVGGAAWGEITGTLSAQTDLQSALNGKASSSQGVTNGDGHDHVGGDGADIDHGNLTGINATQHHTNANDPTSDQKAACAGTSGTPSVTNKFVTDADARNTNARTPTAHNLAGGEHNADTLANLNAKISDADVVALAGQIGGSASNPDIRGLRETSGPTLLTIGIIKDAEFLIRSGTTIISSASAGGGLTHGQIMSRVFLGG